MHIMKSLALAFAVSTAIPATAAVTQILTPDLAYTSSTTLLSIPGDTLTQISDADLTVTFSTAVERRQIGAGWATWGSPPDTESSTPQVLFPQGATSLEFSFSQSLSLWGFEAEPDPFELRSFAVDYYSGATLLGSINRDAHGSSGARLLAATSTTAFDRVVVSSTSEFAIAQLRYGLSDAAAIPEPATWVMLIAGFGLIGTAARRQRRIQDATV